MRIITLKSTNQPEVLNHTLVVLEKGGLVITPSDTVYGLLVDATNEKAVSKLVQFKQRPPGKPISVFVSDFEMMKRYVVIDENKLGLLNRLLPGPFTSVLKSYRSAGTTSAYAGPASVATSAKEAATADKHELSTRLLSEKRTLGVRIPLNRFIVDLVKRFGRPVTATSANLSGRSPHYSIQTLLNELPDKKKKLIDLIIDAGILPRNKPSTVVDLTGQSVRIIRQGDIVFKNTKEFISASPSQTKKIAQFILNKLLNNPNLSLQKPLIFILEGDLGVGKTVFVKGLAEYFGIKNIISPTFVIYYEYVLINQLINTFVHIDLYNIQDPEEFKYLHLDRYLKRGNLLCIEWGEKAGELIELFKRKGKIVYVSMKYKDEKTRKIQVKN